MHARRPFTFHEISFICVLLYATMRTVLPSGSSTKTAVAAILADDRAIRNLIALRAHLLGQRVHVLASARLERRMRPAGPQTRVLGVLKLRTGHNFKPCAVGKGHKARLRASLLVLVQLARRTVKIFGVKFTQTL